MGRNKYIAFDIVVIVIVIVILLYCDCYCFVIVIVVLVLLLFCYCHCCIVVIIVIVITYTAKTTIPPTRNVMHWWIETEHMMCCSACPASRNVKLLVILKKKG